MHPFRETYHGIRRAPFLTFLSAAMVALALFVVGLFAVVTYNLHQALRQIEEGVELVVYLHDYATDGDVDALRAEISVMSGVRAVRHVSREQALEIARRELPEFDLLFSGLDDNPLPASFEVELLDGFRDGSSLAALADAIRPNPAVEEVRYGEAWVNRLALLQRIGALATAVLGGAFSVIAALIIGTAIRIAIFARREEIHIMRLVGARDGFIQRPFLLEGMVTGALGGILALGLTWSAHSAFSQALFPLAWIPGSWVLGGLGAGILFGFLASAFAVRRHLGEV
jgi:cell division transport system permease protein